MPKLGNPSELIDPSQKSPNFILFTKRGKSLPSCWSNVALFDKIAPELTLPNLESASIEPVRGPLTKHNNS